VRRILDVGGSRGTTAPTRQSSAARSQFGIRPGTHTPAGYVGGWTGAPGSGPRRFYNTVLHVGRSFPGEGSETYPAERNNVTTRLIRRIAEPHTRFRIQRGADIDPRMPALELGLPWRPAPDSPPRTGSGGG
jgi:hypothetical protein